MLLEYDDVGAGPLVVLLHGFPLDRTMWVEQVPSLAQRHRVLVPDLRGHGKSAPTDETVYTMDEMADDVIELLDHLGVNEPVAIAGLSMGGYLVFSLAIRRSSRFHKLVLLDTRATGDSPEAKEKRQRLAAQVESEGSNRAVVEAMLPNLFCEASRSAGLAAIEATRGVMEKTPTKTVAAALRGMAVRHNRALSLPWIAIPSLVIVGEDDAITPPEESAAIVAGLAEAKLVMIPNAGHMSPLENPDAVNRALLGFLGA